MADTSGDGMSRATDAADLDERFQVRLQETSPSWRSTYGPCASPFLYAVPLHVMERQRKLWLALRTAIHALVEADSQAHDAVRARVVLTLAERQLVDRLHKSRTPYRIGSFRPDYVIGTQGEQLICEINARFTLNGYLSTPLGLQAYGPLPISTHSCVADTHRVASALLFPFKADAKVYVIKGREHGYSVHLLNDFAAPRLAFVRPEELRVDGGCLRNSAGDAIRNAILELHQDEILGLSEEVLEAFCNPAAHGLVYMNDLRTIFLVHDKRFLSLLWDPAVMAPLVGEEIAGLLHDSIVPTWSLSSPGTVLEQVLAFRAAYLTKPATLGKGEGIRFGKDFADAREWVEHIHSAGAASIQAYVAPMEVPLFVKSISSKHFEHGLHRIVGTFLCTEEVYLGLGIFRSSPNADLVAISRNGAMHFPVVADDSLGVLPHGCQLLPSSDLNVVADTRELYRTELRPHFVLPPNSYISASRPSVELADACRARLLSHGFAVLRIDCPNYARTEFLKVLVGHLGYSVGHDQQGQLVWDVRLTPGGPARSHKMDEFPMHTDCSYEDPVPRFMALLFLRADSCGNGVTRLVKVDDLLRNLSGDVIEALRLPYYRFAVPPEFYRGHDTITAPVLFNKDPDVMRFRADIISVDDMAAGEQVARCRDALEAVTSFLEADTCSFIWMPSDHLLLLDNARYLHGRTPFHDPSRHLQRMRFSMFNESS